jgi:kynurenine formamidase
MTELSNWGRWGKADQMGTVNLITAAKKKQAALLVRDGITMSIARTADVERAADNEMPFGHVMTATGAQPVADSFAMDTITVSYHGSAHTHMDSLSHMFYRGQMYNGYSQSLVTRRGAQQLAVTAFKHGIVTRGILMDIPRLKGVPYLEPGTPIYPADLDAWEKKTGVTVKAGDAVFIRTGRWVRRIAKGPWDVSKRSAGLHASCLKWLKQRDVAVLGSDAAGDVLPSGVDGVAMPIHQVTLIAMGMPIFDNCELDDLGELANRLRRWEFLLTAAPLPVPGATGSPVNPLATF